MLDQEDKILYNIRDLQRVLGVGRTLAYKLVSLPTFPKICINNRYYIPKEKLTTWIERNISKSLDVG